MISKKIITCIALVIVIGTSGIIAAKEGIISWKENGKNITVLSYKQTAPIENLTYKIDKYENEQAVGWVNDNTVLTLSRSGSGGYTTFGLLDVNSGAKKELYTDLKLDRVLDISQNGKYVLYRDYKEIPKDQNDLGRILIKGDDIKILNLDTGESVSFMELGINDNMYKWIGDDKIFVIKRASTPIEWNIIDTKGNLCDKGVIPYNGTQPYDFSFSGVKEVNGKVEGKLYYRHGLKQESRVAALDLSTKETKTVLGKDSDFWIYSIYGDTLLTFYSANKYQGDNFISSKFFIGYYDTNDNLKKEIEADEENCITSVAICPDENKVAVCNGGEGTMIPGRLDILNLQTGNIKEIAQDKSVHVPYWDESGKKLCFTTTNGTSQCVQIVKFGD